MKSELVPRGIDHTTLSLHPDAQTSTPDFPTPGKHPLAVEAGIVGGLRVGADRLLGKKFAMASNDILLIERQIKQCLRLADSLE